MKQRQWRERGFCCSNLEIFPMIVVSEVLHWALREDRVRKLFNWKWSLTSGPQSLFLQTRAQLIYDFNSFYTLSIILSPQIENYTLQDCSHDACIMDILLWRHVLLCWKFLLMKHSLNIVRAWWLPTFSIYFILWKFASRSLSHHRAVLDGWKQYHSYQ